MSDWGATHSTVAAALAGLDMEMPGGGFFTADLLASAVANGTVTMATVDGMATRVLTSVYAAGIMDTPQPTGLPSANATTAAHAALAQTLAEQAAVLLKNEGAVLPLPRPSGAKATTGGPLTGAPPNGSPPTGGRAMTIAVIGAAANCEEPTPTFGFGWPPTIGCLNSGGGSGGVVAHGVDSILSAVRRRAGAPNVAYNNGSNPAAAAAVAKRADYTVKKCE